MSEKKINWLHFALASLKNQCPIALPTETVYGLAASIDDPIMIRKVFAIKERPVDHPLIIHVSGLEMAEEYAIFNNIARDIAKKFWPGPLTLILPKKESVPLEVTGGLDTVGIRMPNHPMFLEIIQHHGIPLAAPSANRFGHVSPTTAEHVLKDFQGMVPVIDGGECSVGVESTILDLSTHIASIRRPGAITASDLLPFVGELGETNTIAPGTLKAHYAPSTALLLSDNIASDRYRLEEKGLKVATLTFDDPKDYAQQLYAELRKLDQLGVDVLIAQTPKNEGIGLAVLDRLSRASTGSPFQE